MLLLAMLLAAGLNAGSPATAGGHLGAGIQLMQAERYEEAAQEFRLALRADPARTQARDKLAICYFELRDYPRARPLFERMTAKESAVTAAYYLGRMDLLEQNPDSAITHFHAIPRDHPFRDELYYLGSAYYKMAKYNQSAESLKRALAANPRDSRVHQLLARAYQKLGMGDQAEMEFAETRSLHDYYLEGSVAIGRCRALLAQKKPEEAWAICRPLSDTDDVDKIAAIGMLFGEAEQYPVALELWTKALALDPDSSEIQYNLALTCFHVKDMRNARNHAEQALRIRPDFVEANVLYGTVLYMGGEDREALAVLSRAYELKPDDTSVRRLLAEELAIAATTQDCTRAAGLLDQAVTLQPDLAGISARMAQVKSRCAIPSSPK